MPSKATMSCANQIRTALASCELDETAACGGDPRSVVDCEHGVRFMKYFDAHTDLLRRCPSFIQATGLSIVRAQPSFYLIYSIAAELSMAASVASAAHADERRSERAVFAMTNDAEANE